MILPFFVKTKTLVQLQKYNKSDHKFRSPLKISFKIKKDHLSFSLPTVFLRAICGLVLSPGGLVDIVLSI